MYWCISWNQNGDGDPTANHLHSQLVKKLKLTIRRPIRRKPSPLPAHEKLKLPIRRPIRRKPSPLPAPEQIICAFSLAKNNEGSMLVERSMLTMRIERSICPRGASVRLPCLSKGACLQCVSRGASVRLQCLSKGACLQCVSRGASVRLQDGCSRLFWFAEDSGLFWKGSTCHSSGLFQTILE